MGIDYSTSDNDSDEELEISDETEALVYEYLKKWEKQLDSMGSVLDNMNRSWTKGALSTFNFKNVLDVFIKTQKF